ncbi:LOW QUALITY PROTEIN: hypothetical protein JCM19037_4540 [Geomicrobium sp. JCM 19037]|nr:LOW QUALITY PROTEIN: hypothetical protein JCM19037_4540 [Geomicrobium sp. JCM 19037]
MSENNDNQPLQSNRNKWGVLIAALFAGFTVVLNNSLMNVALPHFMQLYTLTAVEGQWIITAFALGMTLVMPLTGYLSKRVGSKKIFLLGTLVFLVGSIAGPFSWDFTSMIGFRLVQGIGGGMIMPIGMMLIFKHFSKNERGFAMGIWGVAIMIAPTIGPTVGGIILEYSSWEMLYIMNVPTSLLSLVLAIYFLTKDGDSERVSFDWLGFLLVSGGIIGLLVGVDALQSTQNGFVYFMIGLGFALLIGFVLHELRTDEPLLDIRVLKNFIFTASLLLLANSTIAMFSVLLLIPILIQDIYGLSALYAGLLLFPQALSMGISMTIGGRILDKKGPYPVIMTGVVLICIATFGIAYSLADLQPAFLIALLILHGFANGFVNTPVTTAGLNALPANHLPAGTALNNVSRQMMKVISVVLLSMLFEARRHIMLPTGTIISPLGYLLFKMLHRCRGMFVIVHSARLFT